jgi:hypothetical protein
MTNATHDEESAIDSAGQPGRTRRRFAYFLIVLAAILMLAFIPPLINAGRFQHRVDAEISAALGRPVHFDRLSLNLLPMPGFTLENLVIEEDPAFGYEPTLRADEVRINLRLSSLWRHRVEFSSISFTDPSVNLVHTSDGRWNLQGLLLQASQIPAAPTAQRHAGSAPRFPYIEATGARVNLKLDQEKTPVSLIHADFALWQPAAHQWHLRIEADPVRTDIAPGASGTVRIEGTLGGDSDHTSLAAMPIDVHANWQDAQLGGLTSLLLGRDAGLRGDLGASAAILGTIGSNSITASLSVNNARRADFVPPHSLSLSVGCRATSENSFHAFTSIECRLPPPGSSLRAMLALAASVSDVRQPKLSSIRLDVLALPSQTLIDWLGVATPHPPTAFAGKGRLTGALEWGTHMSPGESSPQMSRAQNAMNSRSPSPYWTGELKLSGERLILPALGADGAPLDDVILRSAPPVVSSTSSRRASKVPNPSSPALDAFDLLPVSLPLGGGRPATLTGHVDDSGYSLELAGDAVLDQLFALGKAVPQFGDGLKKMLAPEDVETSHPASQSDRPRPAPTEPAEPAPPVPIDLTVTRDWGQMQIWSQGEPAVASPTRRGTR